MARGPINSNGDGTYSVDLDDAVRNLILSVGSQLRSLVTSDSPVIGRLFPPPYGDDTERNAGYAALAGPELVESRLASLDVLERTAHAQRVSADELAAWMRSINDVRLVLGTILEVTDDGPEPGPREDTAATWAAYQLLGVLLEVIVAALDD